MKTLSVVIAYRLFSNLLFKKDNKALGSLPLPMDASAQFYSGLLEFA
jgi:hypothetical protein